MRNDAGFACHVLPDIAPDITVSLGGHEMKAPCDVVNVGCDVGFALSAQTRETNGFSGQCRVSGTYNEMEAAV